MLSVNPPSSVVTVIMALPTLKAETKPLESTEAFEGLFELQLTPFSVAFAGSTTAVSCWVSPSYKFSDVPSLMETPVTSTASPAI